MYSYALKYLFKTDKAGDADGEIRLDIARLGDEVVSVFWAKRENDRYVALDGYTPLLSVSVTELARGIIIDKCLAIPLGAEAIMAEIGGEMFVCYIPDEKLPKDKSAPRYTVAFAADFHLGGWGSDDCAKEGLLKARDEINAMADLLVTAGDLIQWHGAYSADEFLKYNWNGEKFGDNGETSEEYLGEGLSQWQIAEEYLEGFTVPVYHCQGNHDICDTDNWSLLPARIDHFGIFLKKWIDRSEKLGLYKNKVERDDSVHYYDTDICGDRFIFIEVPRPSLPHDRCGEDQLYWLDRKLFEYEKTGKPIFVMGHCPLVQGLNFGSRVAEISDIDKLIAVLEKHPTAVYVSGHTHYSLDTLEKNSVNGKQEKLSHIHAGGMTTTLIPYTKTQVEITHTVFCEVYDDRLLLRARNNSIGKWISLGLITLDMKKPCTAGSIAIEKTERCGVIRFSAKAEGYDGVCFEWFVNGESAGKGVTLEIPEWVEGGYVALRAADRSGGICSTVYDMN